MIFIIMNSQWYQSVISPPLEKTSVASAGSTASRLIRLQDVTAGLFSGSTWNNSAKVFRLFSRCHLEGSLCFGFSIAASLYRYVRIILFTFAVFRFSTRSRRRVKQLAKIVDTMIGDVVGVMEIPGTVEGCA
jgi:hypothetical protein